MIALISLPSRQFTSCRQDCAPYGTPLLFRRQARDLHHGPDFDRTHPGCGDLPGDSDRLIDKPATCISLFVRQSFLQFSRAVDRRARFKIIQLEKLADLDFTFSIVVGRGRTLCPFDGFLFGFHLDDRNILRSVPSSRETARR